MRNENSGGSGVAPLLPNGTYFVDGEPYGGESTEGSKP